MKLYCTKCGKELFEEAIVCPYCGVPTKNYQPQQVQQSSQNYAVAPPPYYPPTQQPNITVVNRNVNKNIVGRKRRSILFDIFMICITGGLWIIWMIIRR